MTSFSITTRPLPSTLHAACLSALVVLGCYSPKIEEGAFLCGADNACPDGFKCIDMRCFKSGSPGDGSADTGLGGTDARQCSPPTGSTGACDPVCQTGCRSGEQCSHNGSSNQCRTASVPGETLYASCDPFQDSCRAGLTCLGEYSEACGSHCYRFCRTDLDCGDGSRCTGGATDKDGNPLYRTCSPRGGSCNPTGTAPRCTDNAPADRTFPTFACYIASPDHPDETVCECAGTKAEGQPCKLINECVPGNECISTATQEASCRRLCTPIGSSLPAVVCPALQTCRAFPGTRKVGYCL